MILYLTETCDAFNYEHRIVIQDYKSDPKSKGNSIIIEYLNNTLSIPLANIVCIVEEKTMNQNQLKELESLLKLVSKYKLERLELPDGTCIIKKMHLGSPVEKPEYTFPSQLPLTSEEILFGATSAPKLTLEDFDRMSANSPKDID